MKRNGIVLVWIAGALLALLLVAVGPAGLEAWIDQGADRLQRALARLDARAIGITRAMAIALFVVFVALCLMAIRQRQPAGRTLVVVTVVFVVLVGWPSDWNGAGTSPATSQHWVGAFLLALVASIMMTLRLVRPSRT